MPKAAVMIAPLQPVTNAGRLEVAATQSKPTCVG
jgi:hypothetical protein